MGCSACERRRKQLQALKDKKAAKGKNSGNDAQEQLARDNQLRMGLQMVKSLPKMREIKAD